MPTTANFSLEYPDDNSSVDIAGHFETLADDVDTAINTRLALTGGTLTGSLSGTSLSLSSTLSVTGAITGTSTTDASSSTTGAIKTAGGMGVAKALYIGTTLNVTGATTLTGNVTMSGNLNGRDPDDLVQGPASATDNALVRFDNTTGKVVQNSGITVNDSGYITSDLTVTGATTLTGDLTISKASPTLTVNASSGSPIVSIDGVAGQIKSTRYRTGTSLRWLTGANATAESGSDAGSDFVITRYNDAGAGLGTVLTITRSTGDIVLASTTDSSSSTTGAFKTAGGMGIAKALYVGTTLNVTGTTTLTGDLTISKASATARINATSGDSEVHIDRTAGNGAYVVARTGTSSRWRFGSGSDAESGSNVGSDFILGRFSDAGSYIDAPLTVYRSTGKVSIGSVGATAGLQLGAGGPRMMSGTGSPEGVVSAPVGSQWTDTAATTGAVKWIKASGTGNTGWVVEYGDTGRRNVVSLMTANATDTVGSVVLRRVGALVSLQVVIANSATATSIELFAAGVVPSGFRPSEYVACGGGRDSASSAPDSTLALTPGGASHYRVADGSWRYLLAQYLTTDAWPTSLPGSAA